MPARPTDLRAALLRTTEAEIAEHGLEATTLRGVARRLGVSHQAPGHHFGDRAGLLTALAVEAYGSLAEAVGVAAAGSGEDPVGELSAVGVAYVTWTVARPGLFAVVTGAGSRRVDDPATRVAAGEAWGVLDRAVAAAQAAGWGGGQPRQALVALCFSLVHGVATLARDGLLASELGEDDAVAVARAVTQALEHGFRAPGPG